MTRRGMVGQLAAVNRAGYDAIAATPTPALDEPLRRLSRAADKSRIWLALAAVMAVAGGPADARVAARGCLPVPGQGPAPLAAERSAQIRGQIPHTG